MREEGRLTGAVPSRSLGAVPTAERTGPGSTRQESAFAQHLTGPLYLPRHDLPQHRSVTRFSGLPRGAGAAELPQPENAARQKPCRRSRLDVGHAAVPAREAGSQPGRRG
jgi:hypothetical protein